ncbi:MAG: hypothetical protein SVY53_15030 [Chloroflexota bacterium]|nr:hypothetical protein [Chloroflexota bacterium]
MSTLWDVQQEIRIYQVDSAAISAKGDARKAQTYVKELEGKVDSLTIICRAMWELLREKNGLSEEQLIEKVKEVDLLDGKLDGKVRLSAKECSSCGRLMSPRHSRCMYCGTDRLNDTAFDSVSQSTTK